MKKFLAILFASSLFISNANAACDDAPGDGVDYSGCAFSDGQDLTGTFMPNSNLSFTGFIKVIFDKSIMMNSTLANGNYPESSFVRANLYETNFTSSNLTRANFKAASLIEANFTNANLFEADFTGANILHASFEGSNLNNATWADGKKCALNSIGKCVSK